MAPISYLIVTQAPTSLTADTTITSASTTVLSSGDWSNSGAGAYTYTGANPQRFTIQPDFNATGLTTGSQQIFDVVKNGLYSTDINTYTPIFQVIGSNNTSLTATTSSPPFIMANGDILTLVWVRHTSAAVTCSIKISIVNVEA